jgi:predicted dehydrogenase
MGNQGHSGEGWRLLCEYVWSGTIGKVTEAYSWTNRPSGFWLQGADRPQGRDPVPGTLDWELWIGPAPMRPYVANYSADVLPEFRRRTVYHPFSWRGWWDFGCGALGDMGCHVMDGANWALKFGAADKIKVEVVKSAALHKESAPLWSTLRYHFPARADMPAMTYTWYDGGNKHNPPPRPPELDEGLSLPESGSVFKGEKATILADTYGGSVRIIPEAKRKATGRPPATLARTKGHYAEFVAACRDPKNQPSGSFDYAGPFTEIVLLGNLALRAASAGAAGPIEWDVKAMKVTNNDAANQFVKPEFRAGYEM